MGLAHRAGYAIATSASLNFWATTETRWQALREEARARQLPVGDLPIFGSDLYGDALKHAQINVEAAGLSAIHPPQAGQFPGNIGTRSERTAGHQSALRRAHR